MLSGCGGELTELMFHASIVCYKGVTKTQFQFASTLYLLSSHLGSLLCAAGPVLGIGDGCLTFPPFQRGVLIRSVS